MRHPVGLRHPVLENSLRGSYVTGISTSCTHTKRDGLKRRISTICQIVEIYLFHRSGNKSYSTVRIICPATKVCGYIRKEKDACIRKETWKKSRIFTTTAERSTGRQWSGWGYTQKTKNVCMRTETRKRDLFSLLLSYL